LIRRNPKKKSFDTNHLAVTDLSSFTFCPASLAINLTYMTEKSDEIYKSEQLRAGKFFEQFLENVRRKRSVDFMFEKMKLPRERLSNWVIEQRVDGNVLLLRAKGEIPKWRIGKDPYVALVETRDTPPLIAGPNGKLTFDVSKHANNRPSTRPQTGRGGPRRKELSRNWDAGEVKEYECRASYDEYLRFVNRGDYGELLTSEIVYRGHKVQPSDAFCNPARNLYGIPDYMLKKPGGLQFLLLEKHTWRDQIVTRPFSNHILQALGYLIGLPQLQLSHAYLLYLQSGMGARLYRINTTTSAKDELDDSIEAVTHFKRTKQIGFDPASINMNKCFRCSVRMYCYHKSGNLKSLELPYNTE
jgi:CRISPR/Cas system-associated exonuclease Cas4 (RecB family)